ncbi:elongator complex protein 4 isoform X2 [Colossoma macropomum]|uniref:elongator complex protein 4 isoform X2 n=1 Tax=Colossoma macropomum TaxID=42526 RepID=UPI0018653A5C|nr:elongator complex protein 4 isoform X2 [Colossoma macropomum]
MAAPVQTQACSSFRRSAGRAQLRGTRTTGRALLTTSSGVTGLDRALGGGLAVGSLLLIEEDQTDSYSRLLLQYFLAEGVVCGHQLYLASARDHPDDIIQDLPLPILDDDVTPNLGELLPSADAQPPDAMKIAWRYQNLPKVQTELASSSRFGHYYDLSKRMDSQMLQATQFHTFYLPEETEKWSSSLGPYSGLLRSIQTVIRNEGFDGSSSQSKSVLGRMVKLSDAVVALESFCSSERETSAVYREYHGLLHIRQVPHLNCLVCEVPDNKDLAFKLKRKQFSIEKLHLPPDLSETVSRVSESKAECSSGCGSAPSGHAQLDF